MLMNNPAYEKQTLLPAFLPAILNISKKYPKIIAAKNKMINEKGQDGPKVKSGDLP